MKTPTLLNVDIPVISVTSEDRHVKFLERLTLRVKNSRKLRMRVFYRKIKIGKILNTN